MLFMGQELAETAPFLYFTSHGDPELAEAVREGRRKEFAGQWLEGDLSDPQALQTYLTCKIDPDKWHDRLRQESYTLHQRLISLRKEHPALANCRKDLVSAECDEPRGWLRLERADPSGCRALVVCNLRGEAQKIPLGPEGIGWELALWTGAVEYGGSPEGTVPPATLSCLEEESFCLRLDGRSAAIYFGRSRTCMK
jgi:maltooligosyltrehalose trehalohydrolase